MALSVNDFVVEHVCPAMGAILANFMFSAPLPSLCKAYAKGSLGELNSLPWAFMTGNCFGWVTYSFLVTDYYVFAGNFPGLLLSLFYNACALKLMFIENMTKVMEANSNNVTTNINDENDNDHEKSVNPTRMYENVGNISKSPSETDQPTRMFENIGNVTRVPSETDVPTRYFMNVGNVSRAPSETGEPTRIFTDVGEVTRAPADTIVPTIFNNTGNVTRVPSETDVPTIFNNTGNVTRVPSEETGEPTRIFTNVGVVTRVPSGTEEPTLPSETVEPTLFDNTGDVTRVPSENKETFVAMTMHEKVLAGLVLSWSILTSIILFIPISKSERELAVAITVNLNVVFFYGAPLSVIRTVIETRHTGSIHVPTVVLNTANGAFWAAYGLGVEKPLITAPNAIGAILGFATLFLFVVFPKKNQKFETKETDSSDEESVNEI